MCIEASGCASEIQKVRFNSDEVKRLRKALNKNQEEFAKELNLPGFAEGRWQKTVEGGQDVELTADDLERIAQALSYSGPPWDILEPHPRWRPSPDNLLRHLYSAARQHERVAVVGMAGAGKSFLARRLAQTRQALREDPSVGERVPQLVDTFFARRVFVHLGRHPDPAAVWAAVYRGVGLSPPATTSGAAEAVRTHLANKAEKALIVVDDVWKSNPMRGEFERLSGRDLVHVVYTTRDQKLADDLLGRSPSPVGRQLTVGPLPRHRSVELLREYLGSRLVGREPKTSHFVLDAKQLCQMAERLDDHPLSLIVGAGVIRTSSLPEEMFKSIMERNADGSSAMLGATARADEDEWGLSEYPTVRDILNISYNNLNEGGRAAYVALGSFASGEHSIRSDDLRAIAGLERLSVVDELCSHNLLQSAGGDGDRGVTYRLHDLIRAHILEVRGEWPYAPR